MLCVRVKHFMNIPHAPGQLGTLDPRELAIHMTYIHVPGYAYLTHNFEESKSSCSGCFLGTKLTRVHCFVRGTEERATREAHIKR